MTSLPTPALRHHRWLRPLAITAAVGASLLFGAGTALAHVSISPGTAAPGSYPTLSFRVPNESDTASTTSVEIQIPVETPFPSVSAKQTAGWTIQIVSSTLPAPVTQGTFTLDEAVTSVIFTADGTGIGPHEFATFDILVGPVPDVASIRFGAVQTYSDGQVVNWDEPTPAGGTEPDHPAPVLTVSETSGETADDHASDHQDAAVTVTAVADSASAPTSLSDGLARTVAFGAVLLGVVGIGVGLNARRRPLDPVPAALPVDHRPEQDSPQ